MVLKNMKLAPTRNPNIVLCNSGENLSMIMNQDTPVVLEYGTNRVMGVVTGNSYCDENFVYGDIEFSNEFDDSINEWKNADCHIKPEGEETKWYRLIRWDAVYYGRKET